MFVLIHSPFVGPFTWSLVADELQRRGLEVEVPLLHDPEKAGVPYWKHHADAIVRRLQHVDTDCPVILVANTAAGVLLPAISQVLRQRVTAYIFVDAGIPEDGKSRADLARVELPEGTQISEADVLLPTWRDEDLHDILPDAHLRSAVLAELHPQPLTFRQEPIPVFPGWPDAPCGYIKFTKGFQTPARKAREHNWVYRELDGGHFHILIAPVEVTDALVDVARQLGA